MCLWKEGFPTQGRVGDRVARISGPHSKGRSFSFLACYLMSLQLEPRKITLPLVESFVVFLQVTKKKNRSTRSVFAGFPLFRQATASFKQSRGFPPRLSQEGADLFVSLCWDRWTSMLRTQPAVCTSLGAASLWATHLLPLVTENRFVYFSQV